MRAVDLTAALQAGRTSALGVLHRWYGPGQGRPASSPGLLVQLSLWYGDGSRVVHGSDGSWHEHPAEWLPSPLRNSDVRGLRGVGGRARASRRAGRAPASTNGAGRLRRSPAQLARHPSPHTFAAAHHHPRDAGASGPIAHRGRRIRRGGLRGHLRGAAAGLLRPGRGGTHRDAAGGLPPRSRRRRSRPCTARRRQTSRLRTSCGRAARPSRRSPTSASATCRSTTRPAPSAATT